MEIKGNINKKSTPNDSINEIGIINADKNHISHVSPHLDEECNHPSSTQPDLPAPLNKTTSLSFCYAKCQEFQLVFLRCEFFDAKKAALRLVKYLELSCKVCGEEALRRPLRVDDIYSSEEMSVLRAGNQRLLPFRDKSGRRVLVLNTDLSLPSSSQSRDPEIKVILYLWSILMEDIDAQRRGLVVVFWPHQVKNQITQTYHEEANEDMNIVTANSNDRSTNHIKCKKVKHQASDNVDTDGIIKQTVLVPPIEDSELIWKQLFEAIPIRMCAIHICLPDDDPHSQMIRWFLMLAMGEDYRTRVKTHHGCVKDILYSLMGYGFPVETLSSDKATQTVKTCNQDTFIKIRRRIEAENYGDFSSSNNHGRCQHYNIIRDSSSNKSSDSDDDSYKTLDRIECPSLSDVIFRAGNSYLNHPGNMMFREMIESHISEHNAATQTQKKKITHTVIDKVKMKGGRFLEYDRVFGTWSELNNRSQIRQKIATHFKEYRRKIRAQQRRNKVMIEFSNKVKLDLLQIEKV